MKIHGAELFEIRLRLKERFETSFGAVSEREIVLLRLEAEAGVSWSELVAENEPYFSGETIVTARHILRDFIAPLLRAHEIAGGADAGRLLGRIRGNQMAKAAVEMSLWNLEAMETGVPLQRVLGGTHDRVRSGVSVGIQSTPSATLDTIERYLARGYQRIKVKIKPGHDVELVRSIRDRFPKVPLMVDANAAYSLADEACLQALDAYDLMMIEQPLHCDDLLDHSRLARALKTPICLDESIKGSRDCKVALCLGSCRVINIKPGRVGGFGESIAIHDACRAASIPVWCGGMLESGVGRAYNVHLATLPGFTLPGDISESARYWDEDIVEPPFELGPGGFIGVPAGAGLGITVREELIRRHLVAQERLF
ncbi:MAG: o-succinylbenzoate synthase [Acidobacteriota bacterium]